MSSFWCCGREPVNQGPAVELRDDTKAAPEFAAYMPLEKPLPARGRQHGNPVQCAFCKVYWATPGALGAHHDRVHTIKEKEMYQCPN